ncbi:MAG: hypothetical protein HYV09_04720 [Deltaproteobacteria bacterium]|nr:hypothetical protein [Deltaproteobacteria bacterium]
MGSLMLPRARARARAVVALVLASALIPASFPVSAWAQAKAGTPSKKDLEAAKKAFFEGIDLETAKQWDKALEKFEQVAKVRMTPAVRFHIALCKENLGLLIEALHDFELAESDAKAEKVEAVMKEAPEHAAAIRPKIPKLVFKVPADVDGLAVTLDGSPIDPKGGEETLVNPGTHKIEATADKRHPFSQEITVEVGETKTVNIKVPPIVEDAPPPPEEDKPPTEEPKKPKLPVPALVVGGIGVAALVGAGFFALKRSSIKSDLDGVCSGDPPSCPPDKEDAISQGRTYTTLTNVFLIVGVVGVGAGVVLWMTAPKPESKTATPTASLRLLPSAPGANVGGFSLSGAF